MTLTPTAEVYHGDCIETMNAMPPESVDAIVTDPPYGLGFMGRKWDALPPSLEWAEACFRVLKPGGHIAAFGGTRTWHRLAVAIEDAGFELRDSLAWLYGSGFPKSHDVSKGIDKEANRHDLFEPIRAHIREWRDRNGMTNADLNAAVGSSTKGGGMARHWTSTEGGQHAIPSKGQWVNLKGVLGWPDCELDELYASVKDGAERPVTGQHRHGVGVGAAGLTASGEGKARRDQSATPEAAQWDGWGTALKPAFEPIVLARKPLVGTVARNVLEHGTGAINVDACRIATEDDLNGGGYSGGTPKTMFQGLGRLQPDQFVQPAGRWPANVLLDEHAAAWVDEQSGVLKTGGGNRASASGGVIYHERAAGEPREFPANEGGASRFFYVAKAPKRERPNVDGVQHPTVKPLAIMRWLLRLVTPPGGTVLDPFAGSGATLEAALIEGFNPIGIELEAEYLPLIQHRIDRQGGDES